MLRIYTNLPNTYACDSAGLAILSEFFFFFPPTSFMKLTNLTAAAYHIQHFDVTVGKDDGVRGRGHRQHEGEG
jgi:hypothetical protein